MESSAVTPATRTGAKGCSGGQSWGQNPTAPFRSLQPPPPKVGQLRGQLRGSLGDSCAGAPLGEAAPSAPGLCSSAEPLPRHRLGRAPRGQGGAGEVRRGCRAPLAAPRLRKG